MKDYMIGDDVIIASNSPRHGRSDYYGKGDVGVISHCPGKYKGSPYFTVRFEDGHEWNYDCGDIILNKSSQQEII